MNKLVITILCLASFGWLYAQGTFSDLLKKNISHFQTSDRLEYSIEVAMKGVSESGTSTQNQFMHYYKDAKKECVSTSVTVSVAQGGVLLSIMPEEQVMVLQNVSDSFGQQYTQMLMTQLESWQSLNVKEVVASTTTRAFDIEMEEHSDYERIQMRFNRNSGLLESSSMYLRGEYMLGDEVLSQSQIDISYSKLIDRSLKKESIEKYLNENFELQPEYADFTLYNTLNN